MGAAQSSSAADSRKDDALAKTSYYELLGIDKSASADDIKKAYRRKALDLHPDRNYNDVERATALFAEIQSAYEVLSDPQERAWYDSHEEAILHDMDPATPDANSENREQALGLISADHIMRMFRKFNGKIDFTDDSAGFFGYLNNVFQQLAKEEEVASARDNIVMPHYPSFGLESDSHEKVKIFYGNWSSFSTNKSFAWRDRYRVNDAEDRWMRRQMEKENKQFRASGKQEFNEAVRSLVAFVKKRDPRYVPNSQSEEERQQVLRDAAKAQATRMRAANQAQLNDEVPEWTKVRVPDEENDISEEESEEEQIECVACRKTFKSENQYFAHEKSKKHQKTVWSLKKRLEKEGSTLNLVGSRDPGEEPNLTQDKPNHALTGKQSNNVDTSEPYNDGGRRKNGEHSNEHGSTSESDREENDIDSDRTEIHSTLQSAGSTESIPNTGTQVFSEGNASSFVLADSTSTEHRETYTKQPGKAAQKRAKKSAKKIALEEASVSGQKCTGCNILFPSRTKIFQHLEEHPEHRALHAVTDNGSRNGKRR